MSVIPAKAGIHIIFKILDPRWSLPRFIVGGDDKLIYTWKDNLFKKYFVLPALLS